MGTVSTFHYGDCFHILIPGTKFNPLKGVIEVVDPIGQRDIRVSVGTESWSRSFLNVLVQLAADQCTACGSLKSIFVFSDMEMKAM